MQSSNFDTMWMLINTLLTPCLGAPGHMTNILQAENERKADEFEPIYFGNHRY